MFKNPSVHLIPNGQEDWLTMYRRCFIVEVLKYPLFYQIGGANIIPVCMVRMGSNVTECCKTKHHSVSLGHSHPKCVTVRFLGSKFIVLPCLI